MIEDFQEPNDMKNDVKVLYSTAGAAILLNVSVSTVRYHLYVAKDLEADSVFAGRLQFTKETLLRSQANWRGPGRPRETEKKGGDK